MMLADKENECPGAASTSAKTLDDPYSATSPRKMFSPLRALSTSSPRKQHTDGDSDDSDDSGVVFFGQLSTVERVRRMRYEQRAVEKRLRHKDSLDLTRQRPMSFHADDTMISEGWLWNRPTPAPTRRTAPLSSDPFQDWSSPIRSSDPLNEYSTPCPKSEANTTLRFTEMPTTPLAPLSLQRASLLSPLKVAQPETLLTAPSPGPIFRQTARRVPAEQHEAEFGVRLSPHCSPHKQQGKSSALRTQEPVLHDRIPARRVEVRQAPSVASKASRPVGPNRLGSRGAAGVHAALATAAKPVAMVKTALPTQSVASKAGRGAVSLGSRLPRPASGAASLARPVPMAIARLPTAKATPAKATAPATVAVTKAAAVTIQPAPAAVVPVPPKIEAPSAAVDKALPMAANKAPPATISKSAVHATAPAMTAPRRAPIAKTIRVSPVKPALDPEHQRLRCLAMQERARKRREEAEPAVEVAATSSAVDSASNDDTRGSKEEAATSSEGVASSEASEHHGGRSLRASRTVVTSSAARGRALSLNDIIAARKATVPATLADQLRLAERNKKANEKMLGKSVVELVAPSGAASPEQRVHDARACVVLEWDAGTHRLGKGDVEVYRTPPGVRVRFNRGLFIHGCSS